MEDRLDDLNSTFCGCQYVLGAIRIVLPANNNVQLTEADFAFLYHLREISDFLHIQHVTATRLELPDLRIIRGETTFNSFSLVGANNNIDTVFMPKLVEISEGNIYLDGMCSLESVDWTDIAPSATGNSINANGCDSSGGLTVQYRILHYAPTL